MERFRAHEKEFKKKKFSKKALQAQERGNMNFGSGSNDSDSDQSSDDESDESDSDQASDSDDGSDIDDDAYDDEDQPSGEESVNEEDPAVSKQRDIEFFQDINVFVKEQIIKLETELDQAKNKKMKGGGTLKKQKEKVGSLNYKLTQAKKYREKLDELLTQMDYVDGSSPQIKSLKNVLTEYKNNPDE